MFCLLLKQHVVPPPANIINMFGNWLDGIDGIIKARIQAGEFVP
jgi:hypothetical protein